MLIIFDVNVETNYDIFKCNFSCYIYDNIMCLLEMTFFFPPCDNIEIPPPPKLFIFVINTNDYYYFFVTLTFSKP